MKKLVSVFVMSAMICSLAACGGSASESVTESSESAASESESAAESESESEAESEEEATEAEAEAEAESDADADAEAEDEDVPVAVSDDVVFEDAVTAESGDAYLAIVDGQWYVQYWGGNDENNLLTYDAGVAKIEGNGDYTVSVNADTNGLRYDVTGDANDEYIPSGMSFMAVMVKDGETLYPNMVITVNSVTIDGTEVPMSAKAYTSSDDGKETRANLYNEWVSVPSPDGRSVDGNLYEDDGETATAICADYSAQVIDPAAFADGWQKVEVNFTVSGIE